MSGNFKPEFFALLRICIKTEVFHLFAEAIRELPLQTDEKVAEVLINKIRQERKRVLQTEADLLNNECRLYGDA
ncbi:MAG: hypothetical protein B6D35_12450 [Candidatus Brocadia sp. UTAMX2]|jgi:hypothetical protein|nr:MAG: hypothetical protein B6D35_12450 [Candidatus Brocadia sp. UTAMX2]